MSLTIHMSTLFTGEGNPVYNFFTIDFREIKKYIVPTSKNECSMERCQIPLSPCYRFIINKLKEAGLLNEDYKEICCDCYAKEKPRLVFI